MEKSILHVDINNCYASIELLHHQKLRGHPVSVGGDIEQRHGIILASNYEAKAYGIKTAMTIGEAKGRCPHLITVPPNYDLYLRFSNMLRNIVQDYSSQLENFGLDELWVDVTGSLRLFGSGMEIAEQIRQRVKDEMGVTVSIGVSFTKTFAKLGSDMRKPDAITHITKENYKEVVWPLPVSDLLGVGRATTKKLVDRGIFTIGDLANADSGLVQSWLHKWGVYLQSFANGIDPSPVTESGYERIIKSIGNSSTTPRDLLNEQDVKITFYNLAESVAERLREVRLLANVIQVSLRDNGLFRFERQLTLERPTNLVSEITDSAMELLRRNYSWDKPLRSVGIRAMSLIPEYSSIQMDLFGMQDTRDKQLIIDKTIDNIRSRFGHFAINRGLLLTDPVLGRLDAKSDNIIHPIGYFANG